MLSAIAMHLSHVLRLLHSTSMTQKCVQEDIHDLQRQLTAQRTKLQLQQYPVMPDRAAQECISESCLDASLESSQC